jgi:hypothetical protein
MMVRAALGAPHPVGLVTWRAVQSIATSCRDIASVIRTPVSSAVRQCTGCLPAHFVGHDNIVCPHVLQAPR